MPQTAPKNCSNLTTTSPNAEQLVPTWLAMGSLLILGKSSRSQHPYVYMMIFPYIYMIIHIYIYIYTIYIWVYIYGKIIELDDLDGGFSSH